ncbi:hypothetical protein LCGC14_2486410 [marine sediment metagenome]|uniref:Uncharacterized protein n=1 Tax=marine sediment metagenome TaxID=412755 RepID=A0A0F9DZS2_9ZZZZ
MIARVTAHAALSSNCSNNDRARYCTFLAFPGVDFASCQQSFWRSPVCYASSNLPAGLASLAPHIPTVFVYVPTAPLTEPPSYRSLIVPVKPTSMRLPGSYSTAFWAPQPIPKTNQAREVIKLVFQRKHFTPQKCQSLRFLFGNLLVPCLFPYI